MTGRRNIRLYPAFGNVFPVGVGVAIPPIGKTLVPAGVPKTGFMIESMVTAIVHNIACLVAGREPNAGATWNAICLADFGLAAGAGDTGHTSLQRQ